MSTGPTNPPRETWQAGIIRELKENVGRLVTILSANAGKSNKNPIDVTSAKELAERINKSVQLLTPSHRLTEGNMNRWSAFWEGWREGAGSWTDGRKRMEEFQSSIKDLEP